MLLCIALPGMASADNESFSVTASASSIINGTPVNITVSGANLKSFYGYELGMTYDTGKLKLESVEYAAGSDISFYLENNGVLTIVGSMAGNTGNKIGSDGVLCRLKFTAKLTGNAYVTLNEVKLSDANLLTSNFSPATSANVTIGSGSVSTPTQPTPVITPPPVTAPPVVTTPTHKQFTDLGKYGWAKNAIETLAEKGIISGTSETTFSPGEKITRADFVVLLVKALGLSASGSENFSDVSPSKYYYDSIKAVKELGISSGTGNNKFNPKAPISRQDLMVFVYKALKATNKDLAAGEGSRLSAFSDRGKVAGYAVESIEALLENGIVAGYGTVINPRGNATRAEAAAIIYRIYTKYIQAQE